MKKLLLLLPILALTACDKPIATTTLTCEMDTDWTNNHAIYLHQKANGEYDDSLKMTNVTFQVEIYKNYAKLTNSNITTILEKVSEQKMRNGTTDVIYKGNLPSSTRTVLFTITKDAPSNASIESFGLPVIDIKLPGDNITLTYECK